MTLGPHTIVVLRAEQIVDPIDRATYRDWANATRTTVTGCSVQPFVPSQTESVEKGNDREFTKQTNRVYAPQGTSVKYTDRIEYRGEIWVILGRPEIWEHESGDGYVHFVIKYEGDGGE